MMKQELTLRTRTNLKKRPRFSTKDCLAIQLVEMPFLNTEQTVLDEKFSPDGFNVGVNVGTPGGQTVFHLHYHVIPRYIGDVEDPRGGVRKIKKSIVPYLGEGE